MLHLSAVPKDLLLEQAGEELSEFQDHQVFRTASKKAVLKHHLICFESLTPAAQNLPLAWEMAQGPQQDHKALPRSCALLRQQQPETRGQRKAQSLATCTHGLRLLGARGAQPDSPLPSASAVSLEEDESPLPQG